MDGWLPCSSPWRLRHLAARLRPQTGQSSCRHVPGGMDNLHWRFIVGGKRRAERFVASRNLGQALIDHGRVSELWIRRATETL